MEKYRNSYSKERNRRMELESKAAKLERKIKYLHKFYQDKIKDMK